MISTISTHNFEAQAFWNNKHSAADNKRRVDRLLETFQQKYPDSPVLADVFLGSS